MARTSRLADISTRLQRVADLSSEAPGMVWTTLAHHIDLDLLKEAYHRTRKDGAVGVDGQRAEEYAEDLEENLCSLLERFKSGRYKAPPVKRVYIPKSDGKSKRPIGIPTFEDKVLQRAVVMVLEAVYEGDFLDCSYGFRPNRSARQAVETLRKGLMRRGGGFVLKVDIRSFFDSLDHGRLRSILDKRVRDGVIRRVIDKWLKAGVMKGEQVRHVPSGTPQGGVVSPLLANVFLHEVLDKWFEEEVKPRLRGRAELIRYADDVVMVFSAEDDARRVMKVVPKRLGRFGLELHPNKTKLIRFKPVPKKLADKRPRAESFDFLGFTHFWGKSKRGRWVVKSKTARKRFTRALRAINEWCNRCRHVSLKDQHRILGLKLRGHYQYYGIVGNANALYRFRWEVRRIWRKWLDRRSQRSHMTWERYERLLKRYPLPKPKAIYADPVV